MRDALLGRLGTDLDFTTDARPEQMQRMLRPWADALWDTGIEFGTLGVGKGDQPHGDHHVPRRHLRPGVPQSGGAVRRPPRRRPGPPRLHRQRDGGAHHAPTGPGEFLDPLGGLAALRARVLDTPAAPEVSFGDDPLRMLRAARFVSQLGFAVAPRVREAMAAMADQLGRITAERVAAELDKLMLGADPVGGHRPDGGDRPRRCGAARGRRDADGHRRTPPAQGRLPAFADRAAAGDRARGAVARIWCCGGRRCCTTSASPRRVGTSPTAG